MDVTRTGQVKPLAVELLEAYSSGKSVGELASKTGISADWIEIRLRAAAAFLRRTTEDGRRSAKRTLELVTSARPRFPTRRTLPQSQARQIGRPLSPVTVERQTRVPPCRSYGLSGVETGRYRSAVALEALPGGTKTSSPHSAILPLTQVNSAMNTFVNIVTRSRAEYNRRVGRAAQFQAHGI